MATPDPDKRQYWIKVMFCFTSYNVGAATCWMSFPFPAHSCPCWQLKAGLFELNLYAMCAFCLSTVFCLARCAQRGTPGISQHLSAMGTAPRNALHIQELRFSAVMLLHKIALSSTTFQPLPSFSLAKSYLVLCAQQHGFNAVMMLGELMLNRIPAIFALSGVMALWLLAYGAWSTVFFWKTGRSAGTA